MFTLASSRTVNPQAFDSTGDHLYGCTMMWMRRGAQPLIVMKRYRSVGGTLCQDIHPYVRQRRTRSHMIELARGDPAGHRRPGHGRGRQSGCASPLWWAQSHDLHCGPVA